MSARTLDCSIIKRRRVVNQPVVYKLGGARTMPDLSSLQAMSADTELFKFTPLIERKTAPFTVRSRNQLADSIELRS